MSPNAPPIRGVSDTAKWVAYFRACETKRPDALFRDPFAERLAGQIGFQIANSLTHGNKHEWGWAARTYLFDQFLAAEIQQAQVVVNLAAGLDARPYRMDLPASLFWVEVDLPENITYKEEILGSETPHCRLERVSIDLSDIQARRALFARIEALGKTVVVLTEGLLLYFTEQEVASLAVDLGATPQFHSWITDLASPGQLRFMQRTSGKQLSEVGAAFKFAPLNGAHFFADYGWEPHSVQGLLKTAAQFQRAPSELLSLLPEPKIIGPRYPWAGVCLLRRKG